MASRSAISTNPTWCVTGWCGKSSRRTRRIRTGKRGSAVRGAGGSKGGRAVRRSGGPRGLSVSAWREIVRSVLGWEKRKASISVAFLGPARMKALNREWKGHDTPTDVLSFALPSPDGELIGDVYICPAVARAQAKRLDVPARQELIRLVVHGTLHVLGYDHPEGEGRTRSTMWRRQERYVKALA